MRKTARELIFILIAIASIILVVQVHQYLALIKCKAEEHKSFHSYSITQTEMEERKLHPHANPLWYYTLQEVEDYYKIHYNREERLQHYICQENGKYIGETEMADDVLTFEVPGNFIQSILSHLQQGLEKDWFKFIFWIDLNHGHPFLSRKAADDLARKYDGVEYLLNMITNKKLGILYHSAEHFDPRDPATDGYKQTRNIIGWFDGKRPIELVYANPADATGAALQSNTVSYPKGCMTCWWMGISAHHKGEFSIVVNGKTTRLDISFYVFGECDGVKYKHKTSDVVDTLP